MATPTSECERYSDQESRRCTLRASQRLGADGYVDMMNVCTPVAPHGHSVRENQCFLDSSHSTPRRSATSACTTTSALSTTQTNTTLIYSGRRPWPRSHRKRPPYPHRRPMSPRLLTLTPLTSPRMGTGTATVMISSMRKSGCLTVVSACCGHATLHCGDVHTSCVCGCDTVLGHMYCAPAIR